jgi:hypothetical protein
MKFLPNKQIKPVFNTLYVANLFNQPYNDINQFPTNYIQMKG